VPHPGVNPKITQLSHKILPREIPRYR
jgi:hypothetical protein